MNLDRLLDKVTSFGRPSYSDTSANFFDKIQFTTKSRIRLYRKFSTFLKNGIPIKDVVDRLAALYEVRMTRDVRVKILRDIQGSLSQGSSFSDAISPWIPNGEAMLLRAGEQSSSVTAFIESFDNLINAAEGKSKLIAAIAGSLAQPIVLLCMLLAVVGVGSVTIIPKMAAISDPDSWSDVPRMVYYFSIALKEYWLFFVAGMIGLGVLIYHSVPNYTGGFREYLDYLPPWNIYKRFESASFLVSASAMLKTGVPMLVTVNQLSFHSSNYVNYYLDQIIARIRGGSSSGQALDVGFFDVETTIDVEVYSESTDIGNIIDILGEETINNTIASVTAIAKVANVVALALVGLSIGTLFYSIFEITDPSSMSAKLR